MGMDFDEINILSKENKNNPPKTAEDRGDPDFLRIRSTELSESPNTLLVCKSDRQFKFYP